MEFELHWVHWICNVIWLKLQAVQPWGQFMQPGFKRV